MRSTKRSHRLRLIRKLASIRVKAKPAKKTMDDLPEEIILKIGDLLSDVDLVSYSHANLRTFKIFSKASLIWKTRLDPEDQSICLKTTNEIETFSCPEKEMFFRRSKSERNWRKNNFKVIDNLTIHDDIFLDSITQYRDFCVHI